MPHHLSPERWRRLEALFIACVDLTPGEQSAAVARDTADDAELRRELTGMLEHASGAGGRIARAIEGVAHIAAPATNWTGRHFGPYRIVREIGRGGMGLVFEAVRDDDEYTKTVALKMAPWWRDATLIGERFRLERQILAGLEHPNIARFLDGGTEDGVPYFVMEYVEGRPITEYCQRHGLAIRERIALVRQVCAAIHHAHESLVVHRDLKPANILVSDAGVPKLLDFGIAKLLDPLADPSTTVAGMPMWTPDYTSPEQVRGRPVTTRTDVYSLGLILDELLTGERAQLADPSSPLSLDRSICEVEPVRPSERAAARGDRAAARLLRGDLDTIAMTAIRKEPERRYGSAAALSEDLGRYLEGRTILARPGTVMYRTGKFLRRHRAGAVAAALLVSSITAGVVATVYQARRAERRFQQVRTLANAFVFDVHDRIENLPGSTEARKAIVQTALVYLENLRSDAAGDPAVARELAAAYEKIGNVQGNPLTTNLGDAKGAIASFSRAEEILTPLADRGDRPARLRLVSVARTLAALRRAQGDGPGAATGVSRARDIGERLVADAPADREALALLGGVYVDISRAAYELGDYTSAEESGQRVMEIAQRLVELDPASLDYRDNLSSAYNALGPTRIAAGRLEEAAEAFRASVAIRERLVGEHPNNAAFRRNLLISYGNLGDVLGYRPGENLGDATGAAAAYEKAVELAEWARRHDPADRRALYDLSNARLRLGSLLVDDPSRADAALSVLEEAERLNNALLATDPTSNRYGYVAVVIERRIGEALLALGRTEEAARRLESVRTKAATFLSGPTGPNARYQRVAASLQLAALRARGGDHRALALAEFVSKEMAQQPIGVAAVEAKAYGDLGRVQAQLARSGPRGERDERLRAAIASFEKGVERWRQASVPKALEPHRVRELAALTADLEAARGSIQR